MKQSRREDTSAIPATSTVPSPTLLQIMDFIYGLEHSPGMRFTLNWSIYLTELRNENGDAVFTGDIYTHDRTEPPRFYRWLRFQWTQTRGIYHATAYEDYQMMSEFPVMTFPSFVEHVITLFEAEDFDYSVADEPVENVTMKKRRPVRRNRKKPYLQELFDFCYEVSHFNGGILDGSVGVQYDHDKNGRLYYEFSPGRHRAKGVPIQKFYPSLCFCYDESIGIYAVFAWEDPLTPVEHKKLSFNDLKALVCRLYQIDGSGQSLPTKEP